MTWSDSHVATGPALCLALRSFVVAAGCADGDVEEQMRISNTSTREAGVSRYFPIRELRVYRGETEKSFFWEVVGRGPRLPIRAWRAYSQRGSRAVDVRTPGLRVAGGGHHTHP